MSGLRNTQHSYQLGVTEEAQCFHCGSTNVSFLDFDRIIKRLDDKKIVVTEIWVCRVCGKEFGRPGALYSPQDVNRIRLRVAALSWCGYSAGTLLAYALLSGSII